MVFRGIDPPQARSLDAVLCHVLVDRLLYQPKWAPYEGTYLNKARPLTDQPAPRGLDYRQAQFITSAPKLSECPADSGCEVAFAGRSNAGKSSAINTLTDNKRMARISKTPGRTQLINFFALSDQQRLVDLPGYGYAKVPLAVKDKWQRHLEEYLRQRQSLKGLVLLMDCRHPMQEFDRMMLAWAESSNMPVHILLTKADKLKKGPANNSLLMVRKELQSLEGMVSVQLFSSLKKTGLDQLQSKLNEWLALNDDTECLPL